MEFPAQLPDIAFGTGRSVTVERLVPLNTPVRVLVPDSAGLGNRWTGLVTEEPFDDSVSAGWRAGTTGVGFDFGSGPDPLGPIGYWDFNTVADADRVEDVSGRNHPGTVSGATFTADRGGFSGQTGDRALSFGGNGRVQVPAAATGAFDSASRSNALSVSLWILGGEAQPAPTSVFWFSENSDGSGARSAQAHLPWSDSVIYWDTGNGGDCCSPAGRISKAEPDSSLWKGRWNHYVFLKRGPEKEIWQNGALFLRGEGSYPLANLRSLTIGAAVDGNFGYIGLLDDFAVWDRALTGDEVQALAAGGSPLALRSLSSFIGTDLGESMLGINATAFVRIPFNLTTLPHFNSLALRIQCDAGFIAYLNGIEVARRNAGSSEWNATATTARSFDDLLTVEEIDLPDSVRHLRLGSNVLAIHGLNDAVNDPRFLIRPELIGLNLQAGRFLPRATPGSANSEGVMGFVAAPELNANRGFFDQPFEIGIRGATPGASLAYTTNGSAPGPNQGMVIAPPTSDSVATARLTISSTTIIRAAAFQAGFEPSPIVTRSYLFPGSVARQPARPVGMPTSWPDGYRADFQVDPKVVNSTLPGFSFQEALTATNTIPTLSLVAQPADLWNSATGLYANPVPRGDAWERPASAELIFPDGRVGFQVNCGFHIHGNISRQNDFTPKHSFRLVFKQAYGPGDLEFPLFGETGVQRFDELVLKGLSTDSWPCVEWGANGEGFVRWFRRDASYIRDQWVRDSYHDMGQIGCRGRFVHLFLNGLYWGIYNLTEHPSSSFQAAHYGGSRDEYDAFKDFTELDSGNSEAWNQMMTLAGNGASSESAYQRLEGNNPDGTRNPAYAKLLNVDNLIDYMVLHIAIGADDWPNHNWWGARRRGPESEGFRFFPWDQEISVNSLQRTQTSWGGRYEEVDVPGTPTFLYARLRANANFRLRFADHVHRHFFNGGALTPTANDARWQVRVAELDQAIVAESARWGDAQRSQPYRREIEWLAHNRWMHDQFWPANQTLALNRFRRVGLYPNVVAPAFSQHGGVIAAGSPVRITAPTGRIYYTIDGTDPRRSNGTVSPSALSDASSPTDIVQEVGETRHLRARVLSGTIWSALNEALFVVPLPLAITELMYHPPPQTAAEFARSGGVTYEPDDFEFIELRNLSADRTLNLAGIKFAAGIAFGFGDVALGPLERVVVVRNRAAFENRYGAGLPVVGEYGDAIDPLRDSQLANGGERLELTDALGIPLASFTYNDAWFPNTDGIGNALELLDPAGDLNTPPAWRAGDRWGGTPGRGSLGRPVALSAARRPDGVRLEFTVEAGQLLGVEQATSVTNSTWQRVHLEPMGPSRRTVTIDRPIGDELSIYYRLIE
ncbi:MAG TPA: CotH kinase family protein [Verrucomicrobiota bacterium]|nr:CotH kinase family protein [Verrucomicrobiota bacterium]